MNSVVPENIHGGNWKFGGGGEGQRPRKFQRGGGWTIKSLSRGQYHFVFDPSSNIAFYRPEVYHLRLFLLILTRLPFCQKRFGYNFK